MRNKISGVVNYIENRNGPTIPSAVRESETQKIKKKEKKRKKEKRKAC